MGLLEFAKSLLTGPQTQSLDKELRHWMGTQDFEAMVRRHTEHPQMALLSPKSRALLRHLVLTRKPANVLEIGTYMAGTAEILATALHDVGHGHLHTIDPFGGDRCPPIITQWPQKIRDRVTFLPVDSGMFFDRAFSQGQHFDLVFIDGSHEYEYAYFDLLSAARLARPGCVVMLDNVEQPGPRFAARDFLRDHPEWIDIGGSVQSIDPRRPLDEPKYSFPGTNCFLLQAPDYLAVSDMPRSFGSSHTEYTRIDRVDLDICEPARGEIHALVYLRAFTPVPMELCRGISAWPNSAGLMSLSFNEPLELAPPAGTTKRVEVILAFVPEVSGQKLKLRSSPVPIGRPLPEPLGVR